MYASSSSYAPDTLLPSLLADSTDSDLFSTPPLSFRPSPSSHFPPAPFSPLTSNFNFIPSPPPSVALTYFLSPGFSSSSDSGSGGSSWSLEEEDSSPRRLVLRCVSEFAFSWSMDPYASPSTLSRASSSATRRCILFSKVWYSSAKWCFRSPHPEAGFSRAWSCIACAASSLDARGVAREDALRGPSLPQNKISKVSALVHLLYKSQYIEHL
jgi:hypothetical protein